MQFNTTDMYPTSNTDHLNVTEEFFSTTASEIDIPLLAQSHYYFKADLLVNNYCGLLLVGIGFIGNTLSFLVMIQVSTLKPSSLLQSIVFFYNSRLIK